MTTHTIVPCTVADGAALSRNNISAFWQDSNWVLSWRHTTLEDHIVEIAKRVQRILVSSRETLRHQKAVDPETGRILGYCRWILPPSHATLADGRPVWPEAMVPAVSPEEEAEIQRVAATAIFNPNKETDPLDDKVTQIKNELMGRKPYLRA